MGCIDTAQYSPPHSHVQWSYLSTGLMVDTDFGAWFTILMGQILTISFCCVVVREFSQSVRSIAGRVFGQPRSRSMIGIKCLRLTLVKPRVAQPDR